jgi:hypothetical protein
MMSKPLKTATPCRCVDENEFASSRAPSSSLQEHKFGIRTKQAELYQTLAMKEALPLSLSISYEKYACDQINLEAL